MTTRKTINEAKQQYNNHPEIVKAEAVYLLMEKRYGQALETYIRALTCQEKYAKDLPYNLFPTVIHEVYYSIANILYLYNREPEAFDYYVEALKINRFYALALKRLFVLFQTLPENDVIAFINSIYSISSEEDVQFLIAQALDCGRANVVLFYVNLWNNVFGHEDDALIYAFISQRRYDKALEIALLYLKTGREYAPLAASVMIMGSLYTDANRARDDIGADYSDIIRCYAENRMYMGNSEAYLAVLSVLAKLADQRDIENYLRLCIPGIGMEWNIAESFLNNFQFERALRYYENQYEMQVLEDMRALAAFNSGFCWYKLKRYRESLGWFEKAALSGYGQNDLSEYLHVIAGQSLDGEAAKKAGELIQLCTAQCSQGRKKLHLGCGRDFKKGWINLDFVELPGVDVVADLDACASVPLPFDNDAINTIYASHVIEHIRNPLPMMQELHRISKPGAKAVFRCPYGASDDAHEDPTHVKQYFINSFRYFSQPCYWGADKGYRGDWRIDRIILIVDYNRYGGMDEREILSDISENRNTVTEIIVDLSAVKPPREQRKELDTEPMIDIRYG